MSSLRLLTALVFCLLGSGNAAFCQSSHQAIDPQAAHLLEQMTALYQNAQSLSGTVEVRATGIGDLTHERYEVAFQRPNRLTVTVTRPDRTLHWVANGKALLLTRSGDKTRYAKEPMPDDGLAGLLDRVGLGNSEMGQLLQGINLFRQAPPGKSSLSLGSPATINGIPVDVVILSAIGGGPGAGHGSFTFFIGQHDHLLRRLDMVDTHHPGKVTISETHTNIRLNPALPAAAFTVARPTGAKLVPSLDLVRNLAP